MISHFAVAVSLRVLGVFAAFLFLAVGSRLLPPDEFGAIVFAVTTVTLLHFVAMLGTNTEIVRNGVPLWQKGNLAEARRLALNGAKLVLAGVVLVIPVVAAVYGLWPTDGVTRLPGLSYGSTVLLVVAGVLLFSLRSLLAECLRSARVFGLSMASLSLLPNVGATAIVVAASTVVPAVTGLMVFGAWLAGLLVTLGLLLIVASRLRPSEDRSAEAHAAPEVSSLLGAGVTVMAVTVLYQLAWHGSVWFVGLRFAAADVAVFGICLRAAELVALPGVIIPFLGQPVIAANVSAGNTENISSVMRSLSTLAFAPSVLLLAGIFFSGEILLKELFGVAYADGSRVLFYIALARCFDIFAGSAAQSVLLLHGALYSVLAINIFTLLILVSAMPFLATGFGLEGVGLSLALYFAIRAVLLTVVAQQRTGIATWATWSPNTVRKAFDFYRESTSNILKP